MTDKMLTLFLLACAEGHLSEVKAKREREFYGDGDDDMMYQDDGRILAIENQIEGLTQKLEAIAENEVWTPRPTPHTPDCPCAVCFGARIGRDLITL